MSEPVIAAFDGPPGAGKTSLIAQLATTYLDAAVWFSEPNRHCTAHDATGPDLSRWFLKREADQARRTRELAEDPATGLIVSDRNHLGALAYCYAADPGDAMPYDDALAFYMRHVQPHQSERLRTIVLLVSPQVSLDRRGNSAERAHWDRWYDRGLLERLHIFYRDIAPSLGPNRPLVINTDNLTTGQVYAHISAHLTAAGLPFAPTWPMMPGRPVLHETVADVYAALGGLDILGHPVTDLLPWRGGHVQICQLGTLHRPPSGPAGLWNPAAATEVSR
ncbi:hypothetical protein GCM10022221_35360 [Actinocorallia aurea]